MLRIPSIPDLNLEPSLLSFNCHKLNSKSSDKHKRFNFHLILQKLVKLSFAQEAAGVLLSFEEPTRGNYMNTNPWLIVPSFRISTPGAIQCERRQKRSWSFFFLDIFKVSFLIKPQQTNKRIKDWQSGVYKQPESMNSVPDPESYKTRVFIENGIRFLKVSFWIWNKLHWVFDHTKLNCQAVDLCGRRCWTLIP